MARGILKLAALTDRQAVTKAMEEYDRLGRDAFLAKYGFGPARTYFLINGDGEPFLEVHHVVWLARGSEDTIVNTVALCPNCHRRLHLLDNSRDKALLLSVVAARTKP